MAYKTETLKKKAVEAAKKYKFIYMEDYFAHLGIASSTFYSHFPSESSYYKELSAILDENRISMKIGMRKKWYESNNATLQVGLMKLIGTDEERKRLSQQYIDHTNDGERFDTLLVEFGNEQQTENTGELQNADGKLEGNRGKHKNNR